MIWMYNVCGSFYSKVLWWECIISARVSFYSRVSCIIYADQLLYQSPPAPISRDFTELVSTLASQYFFEDISIPLLAYSERHLIWKTLHQGYPNKPGLLNYAFHPCDQWSVITSCINQLIVSERDGLISTQRGLAERQDSDLHQWSSSSYYLPTVKLITTKWSSADHRLKSEKSSEWDGLWTKWHLLWLWGDNMEPRRPSLVKMSNRVRQIWGKYIEKSHIEKMARIGEKWEDLSEAMGGGGGGGGGWRSEVKIEAFWGSALVWFWVRRLKWSEAMEGGGGQTKMEKWSHTLGQGSRGVMRAAGRIVDFFDRFSPRCYIHLTSDSVWWWWSKNGWKLSWG